MPRSVAQKNLPMAFPEKEITRDLKAWWDTETGIGGSNDPFAPKIEGGSVFNLQPTVDSIRIVRALLVFERHVNFAVPCTVIRMGGYDSFDEMATDLVSKVRDLFNRKNGLC